MKKWLYLLALLILIQALSAAIYIGKTGQPGFPLDDAWIHQTYARNLGLHGVMAFSPGQPSTGSTSFGWTFLLAVGFFGHPVGASGLRMMFEAWLQLRHQAPEERQITTDRSIGLTHNLGGYPGEMVSFIGLVSPELG